MKVVVVPGFTIWGLNPSARIEAPKAPRAETETPKALRGRGIGGDFPSQPTKESGGAL